MKLLLGASVPPVVVPEVERPAKRAHCRAIFSIPVCPVEIILYDKGKRCEFDSTLILDFTNVCLGFGRFSFFFVLPGF